VKTEVTAPLRASYVLAEREFKEEAVWEMFFVVFEKKEDRRELKEKACVVTGNTKKTIIKITLMYFKR